MVIQKCNFVFQESYQVRLQQLEASLQTQTQEHSKKIEEMHKQQKKIEEELAKEKENSAKLENSVTDLSSQCRISLQQMEEFRKEVKEKVSKLDIKLFPLLIHSEISKTSGGFLRKN